jgi:hypothetical protein
MCDVFFMEATVPIEAGFVMTLRDCFRAARLAHVISAKLHQLRGSVSPHGTEEHTRCTKTSLRAKRSNPESNDLAATLHSESPSWVAASPRSLQWQWRCDRNPI